MRRRRLVLRSGDEVLAEVQRLLDGGCTSLGNWSLARTVWHLIKAMDWSLHGSPRPTKGMRRLLSPLILRVVLLSRWIPDGVPLPGKKLMPPDDVVLEPDTMDRLTRSVRAVERGGWFVPHPVFGRMTPAQWQQIHWIHASHHLGFLLPADGSAVAAGNEAPDSADTADASAVADDPAVVSTRASASDDHPAAC